MLNSLFMSARARGWVLFALALTVAMTWGLATQRLEGPDERDHASRAIATVRGNIIGEFRPSALGYRMRVAVPNSVCDGILLDRVPCEPTSRPGEADVDTGEFRHPPPYYAVVGLPSLAWTGVDASYVMRLVSALLGSGLIAAALSSAIDSRSRLNVLSVFTAATPIVWFLVANVNPNGVETAAAACLWASSLTVATHGPSRRVIVRAGIALTVFALSRGISPLYAVIALASAALVAGPARRRELLRRRDVRVGLAAGAVGAAATGAWVLVAGFSHNVHRAGHALSSSLRSTGLFLQQAVGDQLDLQVSLPYAVVACAAVALPIVVYGFARAGTLERRVLASLLVIALVLPLTSDTMNVPPIASAWQGRYGLPMLVGVLIAAAYLNRGELDDRWWRGALSVLGLAHIGAFFVFVRHSVDSSTFATVLVTVNSISVTALALTLDRALRVASAER